MDNKTLKTDVLVVGAGISGISTALEAAETGYSVVLIEKNPYIGGRVSQLNLYFPKLCPPTCGLEINTRRIKDNPNITLLTLAELQGLGGDEGNFKASVKITPRYVKDNAQDVLCEKAAAECPVEVDNEFDYSLSKRKALYLPFNNCYPMKYVFDRKACTEEQAKQFAESFADIIDLDQEEEKFDIEAKSVVWASGWDPYDATKLDTLGYNELPEVITNVEMERLSSPSGPTGGRIKIPGSDKDIKSVAFVQCAGSRDENHLEYCSSICCLASLKQARYLREQYPEADIHIFYIDIRSYGIFEDFYNDTKNEDKIFFHRGKVAKCFKPEGEEKVIVEAEDTLAGELNQAKVDLVILATGMQPRTEMLKKLNSDLVDKVGFVRMDIDNGIIGCGVCTRPKDVAGVVQESTGAAVKAIHTIMRSK